MPGSAGKCGIVDLAGVRSTRVNNTPENFCKKEFASRVRRNFQDFCFKGKVDGKDCLFRIDTGSDVSLINSKLVRGEKKRNEERNNYLCYPTGEKVPILFRVCMKVELGKISEKVSMFAVEMNDDCLLGADFLRKLNLERIFVETLGLGKSGSEEIFNCGRIENFSEEISETLKGIHKNNSENLDKEQKKIFIDFLREFENVFTENIVAGNCDVVAHGINVKDSLPIKQIPRRVPLLLRKEVNEILEEMKRQGVIEESHSPWVSPAVLVRKKDGTIRFCVDYRKLNSVTVKDCFPLPRIDDILDQLSGNSWFTTLDLKSGYWQIKIREEDKEKTAFSIGNGLWQFTVMPFGLCNAPATFERMMEEVLQGILNKICLVYLDDVIIFGKDFSEMLKNLKLVFQRLKLANLKVNPKKCVFFGKKIKYLGHVISAEGVSTDPEKITAVKNWPVPHNKKQLRSFLGFCSYYRRYVKGFSSLAKPLFVLTENQVKFSWDEKCQIAFEELKQVLSSSPCLSFPKGEGEFILDTDASKIGIGSILSQRQDGKERVIAYFSRVLSKAEKNYCITRRELLAIVDSLKSFRHYLLGRKFIIRTDHISLRWLMSFRDLEGQLARWLEKLQEYDFEVVHRKGVAHKNADGLSRRECETEGCIYCEKIERKFAEGTFNSVARIILTEETLEDWRRDQMEDSSISLILQGKEEGVRPSRSELDPEDVSAQLYWSYWEALTLRDGVLYKRWDAPNLKSRIFQLIVPRKRIKEILEKAHDGASGGHFGVNKTLEKIRRRFYWASCKQDVENWCRTCKFCISKKGPSSKGKSPLQIYNVGTPFERLQMDILGPLPKSSSGNRFLLVVVDCFTKWVEAFPLKNMRAKTVAEIFVNEIISRHGVPQEVHTDQGRNFESKLFAELMVLLGIRKTRTTALHPQSDGQVERQHRTIVNFLAKFISENQRDWDRWIPMFLLAYRSSTHESTGVTPAELYLAKDLRLPLDLSIGNPPSMEYRTVDEYIHSLKENLKKIRAGARNRMEIKSSRMKAWYDRKTRDPLLQEGEKVWLFNPRRKLGRAPKLQCDWEGPYLIIKKMSDVVFCIQKTPKHRKKIVHADRLAPFLKRD